MPPFGAAPDIGWEIPPFYCPFRARIHPKADEMNRATEAWLDEFSVHNDAVGRAWTLAAATDQYIAWCNPDGDYDRTLLLAQLMALAGVADDDPLDGHTTLLTARAVQFSARATQLMRTPDSFIPGSHRLTEALRDIAFRGRDLLEPRELHNVTDTMGDWINGEAWFTSHTECGTFPSLEEWCAFAPRHQGARFCFAIGEATSRSYLEPQHRCEPAVQAYTDAAGFVAKINNDFFSYAKGDHLQPQEPSIINVLAREHGISSAEAAVEAQALRDRAMHVFIRLYEQLGESAVPQIRQYAKVGRDFVTGDFAWHIENPRYASPPNRTPLPIADARFDVTWTDRPSDPALDAPDISAIAWWWELLDNTAE
ncbi:MAG: hypothetical protein HOV68_32785 [Streptomycetaceae bacterium]|nr:hypothetical protein [Streptomycetaceae bacterium]